jgi:hypothetical protein
MLLILFAAVLVLLAAWRLVSDWGRFTQSP